VGAALVGGAVVGAVLVGGAVVGGAVVGGLLVGGAVVGALLVGGAVVGALLVGGLVVVAVFFGAGLEWALLVGANTAAGEFVTAAGGRPPDPAGVRWDAREEETGGTTLSALAEPLDAVGTCVAPTGDGPLWEVLSSTRNAPPPSRATAATAAAAGSM
jgi:hypothetical protein